MKILERLKPTTVNDILGQQELLDPAGPFSRLVAGGDFESLIFVGPPGTGKTTLAEIIGETLGMPFHRLHAANAGAADIRNIIDSARMTGEPVLIFIDELHRFSKTQQDLLLKVIDEGLAKIIGASTENPYHSLVPAFRSRSFVFTFKPLEAEHMTRLLATAKAYIAENYEVSRVDIPDDLVERMVEMAGGDARRFLHLVELAAMTGKKDGDVLAMGGERLEELVIGLSYSEDEHFDLLSALIKSIRGSDPDAALVWAQKMIRAGVQPETVFRRLLISASEDIGNAYPDALVFVNAAYESFIKVGMPEGRIILWHAVTYLAGCPKSNRSYVAGKEVDAWLDNHNPKVPANIRHAPVNYRYPFDNGAAFVKQEYLPGGMQFYRPSAEGFESKITDRLKRLWNDAKEY